MDPSGGLSCTWVLPPGCPLCEVAAKEIWDTKLLAEGFPEEGCGSSLSCLPLGVASGSVSGGLLREACLTKKHFLLSGGAGGAGGIDGVAGAPAEVPVKDKLPQSNDLLRVSVMCTEWDTLGLCSEADLRISRACGWWLGTVSMWVPKGLERMSNEAPGASAFPWSSLSNEAERLELLRETLLSWLGLRDRGKDDSKLDSPDDWAISARRSLFFLGGSFSAGSWASVWLR